MLRTGKQQVVGQSDPAAAEQATVASTSPLDQDSVSGDTISQLVGVRIATPFFGTGFNFCVGVATTFSHVWLRPLGDACMGSAACIPACPPLMIGSPHILSLSTEISEQGFAYDVLFRMDSSRPCADCQKHQRLTDSDACI